MQISVIVITSTRPSVIGNHTNQIVTDVILASLWSGGWQPATLFVILGDILLQSYGVMHCDFVTDWISNYFVYGLRSILFSVLVWGVQDLDLNKLIMVE